MVENKPQRCVFFEPSPINRGTRELFARVNCGFVRIIPTKQENLVIKISFTR